ncbi:NAD kinase [Thomasclavelia sp.]|uniref:NAD kinase n=1 Tax=Thomasclavelia sp. TaxID=3025757 RepID=UPI0025E2C629|nr:NAD kinase [Thomasclavelia sp.]
MLQYAILKKQDEISNQIANQIKAGLTSFAINNQENPDLVISIGGDGTMLTSVHQYLNQDVGFIGVHTGTLGFYTDYLKDEIDELIEAIKSNQYKINHRNLLEVTVFYQDQKEVYLALNEMRIDYGFVTQVIDVYIDDELLEVFRGNGLCVSTPSGSTAYNKSIGGAVIYPGTPLMQLSEVAPIQHNAYRSLGASMILDASRVIKLESKHFKQLSMGIDNLHFDFTDVKKIEIKIADQTVKFIEYRPISFIQRIRRAFIWQ